MLSIKARASYALSVLSLLIANYFYIYQEKNITMIAIQKNTVIMLLLSIVVVGMSSCSDNPASTTPAQEHVEAFGLVIYNSGAEVVRYEKGIVTGEIEVAEGEDTPLLTVRFLDEKGNVIASDKLADKAFSLQWVVANTAIADVERHESDGKWNFHIAGKTEGQTSIKIQLLHNDHPDFTSKEIPIHVEKAVRVTTVKILLDGKEAASANTTATGSIAVQTGKTAELEVQLYDEHNQKISLEEHHTVELEIANSALVTLQAGNAKGLFIVSGAQIGQTTVKVRLEKEDEHGHGGGQHDTLYISPDMPLFVQ